MRNDRVIELLLEAERALAVGLVDQAERRYWQAVEADPRNAIAVVGLARVALERADDRLAWELGVRALALDPENQAARRLVDRLAEVMRYRGEALPPEPRGPLVPPPRSDPAPMAEGSAIEQAATEPAPSPERVTAPTPEPDPVPRRRLGRLRRLLGRDK